MDIVLSNEESIRINNNVNTKNNFIDVTTKPYEGLNMLTVYDSPSFQYIRILKKDFQIKVFCFDSEQDANEFHVLDYKDWDIIFESKR